MQSCTLRIVNGARRFRAGYCLLDGGLPPATGGSTSVRSWRKKCEGCNKTFSSAISWQQPMEPGSQNKDLSVDGKPLSGLRGMEESPSQVLEDALEARGFHFALPNKSAHSVNFSYTNPRNSKREVFHIPDFVFGESVQLRLQSIVARSIVGPPREYADMTSKEQDERLNSLEEDLLLARNYNRADVKSWIAILTEKDSSVAAKNLLNSTYLSSGIIPTKPAPVFVLLFLLRRPYLSASAVRDILIYVWHEIRRVWTRRRVERGEDVSRIERELTSLKYPVLDDSAAFIMIVRLIRHARASWPEAVVTVAAMFMKLFGVSSHTPSSAAQEKKYHQKLARTNYLYNKVLKLLAVPSSAQAIQSATHCRKAQLDIVARMAEHKPPLTITREGYRSITATQTASKKSDQEREWDQLKAKSWPPWKEEKTGLDAEKGPEYGVSGGLQAVRHAKAAGYGGEEWEKTAQTLAGWDEDGSPTIQTRTLMNQKHIGPNDSRKILEPGEAATRPKIWAARIRATRTIQEAWACFLAASDANVIPNHAVYMAMLEKLAPRFQPDEETDSPSAEASLPKTAGDSKQVFPSPTSPMDVTYVRTEPPSFDELATEMFEKGIIPQGPNLVLLVSNAKTIAQGQKYLKWATRHTPSIGALLVAHPDRDQRLKDVPISALMAYLKLLCEASPSEGTSSGAITDPAHSERRFFLACRLLYAYKPQHLYAWHTMLSRLARTEHIAGFDGTSGLTKEDSLERFMLMKDIYTHMRATDLRPEQETLRILCAGAENAVLAALETFPAVTESHSTRRANDGKGPLDRHEALRDDSKSRRFATAKDVLDNTASYLGSIFHEITGSETGMQTPPQLPRLLISPGGHMLHAYLRALGFLRDYDGVRGLLRWMVEHQDEIYQAADRPSNGWRLLGRTLVAARVFLERSWVTQDSSTAPSERNVDALESEEEMGAPDSILESARDLMESVESWGGWPDEVEVAEYCSLGHFSWPEKFVKRGPKRWWDPVTN